jgi:hypothetical protein
MTIPQAILSLTDDEMDYVTDTAREVLVENRELFLYWIAVEGGFDYAARLARRFAACSSKS